MIVDAPRMDANNVAPTVVARTSATAYLRLHGRNKRPGTVRGGSAAERFDYLYSREELAEWVAPLRELAAASATSSRCSTTTAAAPTWRRPVRAGAGQRAELLELLEEAGCRSRPPGNLGRETGRP